ncbi:ATP-binding protein [Alteromonas sp. H39]|uniref:ATP-binding protein n=1 Tax=Alteromonas sp. H39 TaxID=3389876 RepID=UPI0039E12856
MSEPGIATKNDTLPGLLAESIADNVSDGIVLVDKFCRITFVNHQAEKIMSLDLSAALHSPFQDLFSDSALDSFNRAFDYVLNQGKVNYLEIPFGSNQVWLSMKVFRVDDNTLCITFHDCSVIRRQKIVADSQQHALNLALSGKDEQEILLPLVQALEKQAPHAVCVAINLTDEHANQITSVTSSRMPHDIVARLSGTHPDSDTPCGRCIEKGAPVVIADLTKQNAWPEFSRAASDCGLAAYWCIPVHSQKEQRVVGTISLFSPCCTPPAEYDTQVVDAISQTVAIVAEHCRNSRARNQKEDDATENTETLLKQCRLYEAVLSNNPDPVYTFDLSGRFTYVNDALLAIWGISWDEAIGKNCYELGYEKWHADMHMREIEQVIETKKPIRSDVFFHGALWPRTYDYIFVPVLDAAGNVEAIAGSTRDVTERYEAEKMAKEAEARRRIALEASHSFGIWDWDIRKNLFTADQRLGELFNLTPEETAYGVPIERPLDYVHPQDVPVIEKAIQESIATGKPYDQQYRILQKDGSIRWGSFRGRVIYDESGNAVRFPGVGVDITREQNAINALQEADKRKDEFLATLAHELRNPLAPIRNAVEILQSGLFSEERKQESFILVERQVTQMVRLVDDLMDVSRITRGKIRLSQSPLDICDAIRDAIESVQPMIDENNHILTVRYPGNDAWVDGDFVRLAQVFTNIINNAAKYTPRGGQIEIKVHTTTSSVTVDITDSGVGIPKDKINDIFDMFSQIEGVLERSQGGLGIGLTLVKRLVELHDGAVTVHSDGEGKGTCISVTFPRVEAEKRAGTKTPLFTEAVADTRTLSVLIADDNQDAAITMGWILEAKGCDVIVVEDGPSALEAVKQTAPDLVLLDIGMPGMNGYDLCIALKKLPALRDAVFVAQTGWGQPSHIKRSKESGFHHHLVKPLDLNDLMPIVDSVRQQKAQLSSPS